MEYFIIAAFFICHMAAQPGACAIGMIGTAGILSAIHAKSIHAFFL
jgi:hypothetical protein